MIYKLIKILFIIAGITSIAFYFLNDWPVWPIFVILLGYIALILVLSTNIQLNFFVKAYHNNPGFSENAVALSFDDGPTEETLEILDILDRHQAKAAFFCIGRNIEKYPEIFKEIIDRGHIVGNHTFSHTRKMGFLSSKTIQAEIEKCDEIVRQTAGLNLNLFRPPFGIINPKTKRALENTGHKVMGWNKRPYDAITKSPEKIIHRITRDLKKGDLILLHDNMPKTAPILEQLLVILKQRNFRTVRPDKLFDIHAYN
ncbi:peptidoglycan/xylan/chitin deacetylase (PgdA/CDA1 family) [Christiangramia gaetbulicola]|uniref:Peptidoglycan/xylan/chitin deacetylase (PgdA/CDA1 family) n=1 Tax=Christiangramia gaetbulicola TaxID=703340 RepID=A0A2T6AGX9_9FLAO|nr:polysaccharide deacetylase family protein [Christiangramia gaetbulicola]PTX43032.1 peptidoglycan/xylan/chitin deacetylase (PgdA/CDA1 family) [Christiangramia gaetbulicola]